MLPKLLTEFIGTFFLVLTIGMTVLIGTEFAPIAIGVVLVAMVYMGGHVSDAHYNPAVTLAFWMRGKISSNEGGFYIGVQLAAAFLAALVVFVINDQTLDVAPAAGTSLFEFFLLEVLFTFALVMVILNVAVARATEGNSHYGIAIGFIVMAGAFAAGPVSGGAFNPAVALGPIVVDVLLGDASSLGGLWVYLIACFAGGALGAVAYKLQHPDEA